MRQVHPYGNPQAPYLIVMGKPNKLEAQRRRAGVGTQFQLIVHALELVGIKQSDCLFVNAVSAKRDMDWKPADVKADAALYLWPMLQGRRMVIACGSTAACALNLSEAFDGVSKLYGTSVTLNMGSFQVPVVLTLDPFLIAQNPRKLTEVRHNLFFGIQSAQGAKFEFPKFTVNNLETVEDIEAMAHKVFSASDFFQRFVAYDHEATLLNQRKSKIVTTAFCNGEWSAGRGFETYLWAPYDALVPRYSPEHKDRMEKALVDFSYALRESAKNGIGGRVGHHRIYDDYLEYMNYLKWMTKGVHWSEWDTKIKFWGYDSLTTNGLKDLFFTFFGVPNYDKVITDEVSKVTQRRARSRYLTDPADFRALEWAGISPEEIIMPKTGEVRHKWPEKSPKLNSKDYAYAVLPLSLLGPYNCQDVVATWLSFRELYQIHERQGTLDAQKQKHKMSIRLHEATMHGMPTDIGMNRDFSKKLKVIEEETTALILKTLKGMGHDEDFVDKVFNPNSDNEVRKILYGQPVEVPVLDPSKHAEQMVEQFGSVKRAATKIDEAFSAMWTSPAFKKAVSAGAIDADIVLKESITLCAEKLGVHEPQFKKTKIYPGALCQPRAFTKTGLPSVSRVILETHVANEEESDAKEFILALLLRAKVKKIRSTFVDSIFDKLESHYTIQSRPYAFCHPTYNEVGTISGRSSSSGPNGQNYPPKVRGQHVPLPGHYFLEFDFKQAEIRVAAAMSNDKALIAALTSGQDLHTQTAMMMFGIGDAKEVSKEQRKGAKSINFGVIYGMSSVRLALMLGITVEEADILINDRYFGIYPELKAWIDEQHRIAKLPPYYVTTPMGTRISTLDALSISQDVRSHAERQAVNAPVQGGAGEYAFWMIDELCTRIERNGWMTAENSNGFFSTVHDSAGLMQLASRNLAFVEGIDAEGKQIVKGPIVEEIESILAMPAPWHPLERVPMGVDLEINYNWSGKPDIMRAIDPNYGRTGKDKDNQHLAWDLIDLTRLSEEERKEIEEITTVGSYAH